jgi:hypothetical protein
MPRKDDDFASQEELLKARETGIDQNMKKEAENLFGSIQELRQRIKEARKTAGERPEVLPPEEQKPLWCSYLEDFADKMQDEREYQMVKHGDEVDARNNRNDWAAFIGHYVGRLLYAQSEEEVQKTLVKVGTLAAAAYEWSKRGMAKRHYD